MTTPPLDDAALDELQRLWDASTPEPWYEDGLLFIGVDSDGNGKGWFTMSSQKDDHAPDYTAAEEAANISFIVAAHNQMPAILSRIRDDEEKIRRLRELLKKSDPIHHPLAWDEKRPTIGCWQDTEIDATLQQIAARRQEQEGRG